MTSAPRSDAELYYLPAVQPEDSTALLEGEEAHHASHVMRCREGEQLLLTNGRGWLFHAVVVQADKNQVELNLSSPQFIRNKFENVVFCIPRLKNPDRMEFALEKCVELGITRFVILSTKRSIPRADKSGRWLKILAAAMKQSIRPWLPTIESMSVLSSQFLQSKNAILFSQHASVPFSPVAADVNQEIWYFFGPEGGTSQEEDLLFTESSLRSLGNARLRAETAVVMAASLLAAAVK